MPIKDTNKTEKPYIIDRDEDIYIGFDMPLHRGDDRNGNFAATSTTLEAVKVNIRNLLQTELGERPMQPNLGIRLRRYLFEQFNEDTKVAIYNDILDTFSFWLPFVKIVSVDIEMSNENNSIGKHSLKISMEFVLNVDQTTIESVQVEIGG